MASSHRQFQCSYLIHGASKRRSKIPKKNKDTVFKFVDGVDESFYFPMIGLSRHGKEHVKKRRNVAIDPWPAFSNGRSATANQIYVSNNGRLFSQGKEESRLPPIPKPRFLQHLEAKINENINKYEVSEDQTNPLRLQIYQEAFELFIEQCAYYGPLLASIKSQYEGFIEHLKKEIKKLQPIKELLWSVSIESEQRVNDFRNKENLEIKELKEEKQRDALKIESLKQEYVELNVTVSKLIEQLSKQNECVRIESDGRKLLITEVNDLTSRLNEMELLARAEIERTADDPVLLKISREQCRKELSEAHRKLNVFYSQYESMVPRANYEEVRKSLEDQTYLSQKLTDDLESSEIRYSVLQQHCSTLSTYRDLYNIQVIYTGRVIGSKSEPGQKIDYINALLSKFRRWAASKSLEELSVLVEEEMQRVEAGGLPVLNRPNAGKSKIKPSIIEK